MMLVFKPFYNFKKKLGYNAKSSDILTNIGAMDPPGTKLYPTCSSA